MAGADPRQTASRTVTVRNRLGLHARAAARFVHTASRFRATVRVARGARSIDGKSIMGLLLLSASPGIELTISADGEDAPSAVSTLCELVERGFHEEPCSD